MLSANLKANAIFMMAVSMFFSNFQGKMM